MIPLNQSQIIEHVKLTCFFLGKVSERQTKTINDQGRKLTEALESLST